MSAYPFSIDSRTRVTAGKGMLRFTHVTVIFFIYFRLISLKNER